MIGDVKSNSNNNHKLNQYNSCMNPLLWCLIDWQIGCKFQSKSSVWKPFVILWLTTLENKSKAGKKEDEIMAITANSVLALLLWKLNVDRPWSQDEPQGCLLVMPQLGLHLLMLQYIPYFTLVIPSHPFCSHVAAQDSNHAPYSLLTLTEYWAFQQEIYTWWDEGIK